LASLIDPTVPQPGPTLPAGHPFNVAGDNAWSANHDLGCATCAWVAHFNSAVINALQDSQTEGVWCVRGGQNVNTQ